MKKQSLFFLWLSVLMISPVALHGAPALPLVPTQAVSNQVGIAAAVRGTVKISNKAQVGKIVSSGEAIASR